MLWLIHLVIIAFFVWLMMTLREQARASARRSLFKPKADDIQAKCKTKDLASRRKRLGASAQKMANAAYENVYDTIIGNAQESPRDAMGAVTRCFAVSMIVTLLAYYKLPPTILRTGRAMCIPISVFNSLFGKARHKSNIDAYYMPHPDQRLMTWAEAKAVPKWYCKVWRALRFMCQRVNILLCLCAEASIGPVMNIHTCCLKTYSRFSFRNAFTDHLAWTFYGRVNPLGTEPFKDHVISAKHNVTNRKYAPITIAYATWPKQLLTFRVTRYIVWTLTWCLASMGFSALTSGPDGGAGTPVSDASMDVLFRAYTVVGIAIYMLTMFAPRREVNFEA